MRTPWKRLAALAAAAAIVGCSALLSADASGAVAQHVSTGCADRRAVALTFDDGPNPTFTPAIVDVLAAHHAKATFFEEGMEAQAHPDVAARVSRAGMTIGAHSYSHSTSLPAMTAADFTADLLDAQAVLERYLGYTPALYRAPFGHTSEEMLHVLGARGYMSIGWDVDSTDWRASATADQIADAALKGAHPGAIILMHDGALGGGNTDRSATLAALPRVIDGLRSLGYDLVTVPEITGVHAAQAGQNTAPEMSCSGS